MDDRSRDLYELLDLEGDGALGTAERGRLDTACAESAELRSERERTARLHQMLSESRITPRPGFVDEVMANLPARPEWAPAAAGFPWRLPVAALVLLAAAATLLVGLDAGGLDTATSAGGLLAAVGSMITSTLLAGAGLLGASWRGVGMALGEALTLPQQVVFGSAVVGLNLFLFRWVRTVRRERAAERPSTSHDE